MNGAAERRKGGKPFFPEWEICHNGEAPADKTEGNKAEQRESQSTQTVGAWSGNGFQAFYFSF
jgi:hypothetical protein